MDPLISTAASGLRSRMETLDLLANNLANSSSAGYKADQESYNLYFGDSAWSGYLQGRPSSSEMPVVEQSWTDLSQGTLISTSSSLDFALAEVGFFVVTTPSGPLFTRNGHFRVSKTGRIETQEGYAVQGQDGKEIVIDPTAELKLGKAGALEQTGAAVGQFKILTVDQMDAIARRSGNYFQLNSGGKTTDVASPDLKQGSLEASNVPSTQAAVKLINVMRQFEMLQKAILLAGQMNQRVVEDVAKVTP